MRLAAMDIRDVQDVVARARQSKSEILVFPIGYGADADIDVLNIFAEASMTEVFMGDQEDVENIFDAVWQEITHANLQWHTSSP